MDLEPPTLSEQLNDNEAKRQGDIFVCRRVFDALLLIVYFFYLISNIIEVDVSIRSISQFPGDHSFS